MLKMLFNTKIFKLLRGLIILYFVVSIMFSVLSSFSKIQKEYDESKYKDVYSTEQKMSTLAAIEDIQKEENKSLREAIPTGEVVSFKDPRRIIKLDQLYNPEKDKGFKRPYLINGRIKSGLTVDEWLKYFKSRSEFRATSTNKSALFLMDLYYSQGQSEDAQRMVANKFVEFENRANIDAGIILSQIVSESGFFRAVPAVAVRPSADEKFRDTVNKLFNGAEFDTVADKITGRGWIINKYNENDVVTYNSELKRCMEDGYITVGQERWKLYCLNNYSGIGMPSGANIGLKPTALQFGVFNKDTTKTEYLAGLSKYMDYVLEGEIYKNYFTSAGPYYYNYDNVTMGTGDLANHKVWGNEAQRIYTREEVTAAGISIDDIAITLYAQNFRYKESATGWNTGEDFYIELKQKQAEVRGETFLND